MEPEKKTAGNKNFRFAAVLSLAVHLFFVASVEGAVFLNKVLSINTPEPFFYFQMKPSTQKPAAQIKEGWNGKIKIPFPSLKANAPQADKGASPPLPKKELVQTAHPVPAVDPAPFSKSQIEIDKKLDKIKKKLDALNEKPAKAISRQSLVPYVSDLEKVPSEARRDLLPGYLKKMRHKIASVWLLMVQTDAVSSGSVTVQYRVKADGSISDLQALNFGVSEAFREACLSAIQEASPFDPLPFAFSSWLKDQYLTIELTFFLERSKNKSLIG